MDVLSNSIMGEHTIVPQLSTPSFPVASSIHSDDSISVSSFENVQAAGRTLDEHISTLQSLIQGDFSDEEGIQALYPDMTEIAAIIQYERLTTLAKAIVRDKQRARIAAQIQVKNQAGFLKIQGPWLGQEIDPIDLKGPNAIPMPVEIGKTEDFAPIFGFLARDESGLAQNKTLKRLMGASAGLTGKGLSCLASALEEGDHALQALDLGASQATKAHSQKFNYFDDSSVEALKSIIMSPSLRWLNIGRTAVSEEGFESIRATVIRSELVFLDKCRVHITNLDNFGSGKTSLYDAVPAPKSCSLEIRKRLAKNQAKYYPQYKDYVEFLASSDLRFLRNNPDVRKIDSMYRTQDKRLGLPMDLPWEEDDPVWKLITEDAETVEALEE